MNYITVKAMLSLQISTDELNKQNDMNAEQFFNNGFGADCRKST